MKLYRYIFFLIFCITSINSAIGKEKIVFIDIDFVLNNSNLGKSIYTKLDKLNKKNFDELSKIEEQLAKKKKSIDVSKNISSKENLEKEINLFNEELKNFRSKKNELLKAFESKKKREIDDFLANVNPIIQEYMKKNSISIVLPKNQILIGNTEMDITNDIMDLVNNNLK
tara:strand:+ start:523 stop:1032 length:510 start_codon:yes stop_codon:yes gene_type:complete